MENNSVLNAAELAKLEKDGLDVVHDLEKFAEQGFSSLTAADFDRLKYIGVYQQRPKADGRFMLRVKIPAGRLNSNQARVLAYISEKYGREVVDVTNRHSIQFHWISIEDIPEILKTLAGEQLTTIEAAGDCPPVVL